MKTNASFVQFIPNFEEVEVFLHYLDKKSQIEFEDRYWNYESKFYLEIYKTNEDFCPNEMYEIHENIRD